MQRKIKDGKEYKETSEEASATGQAGDVGHLASEGTETGFEPRHLKLRLLAFSTTAAQPGIPLKSTESWCRAKGLQRQSYF